MSGRALIGRAIAVAVVAVAYLPAAAAAQDGVAPEITAGPVISGLPVEGQTLTATAVWTGTPAPQPSWQWLRCTRNVSSCREIEGATADSYVATAADVASALRVRLTVTTPAGADDERSAPTTSVAAAPVPQPTPSPTPTATPTPTPAPAPPSAAPAVVVSPEPATTVNPPTPTATPAAGLPTLLDPFPVVRIRGRLTETGARVSLFTVRASRGVRTVARCRGASCPVRRLTRYGARVRLRPLERHLRAGTRLEIRVTTPGRIGKWTRILIRRGAAPRRSDRCLFPGDPSPEPCPDR